VLDPSLRSSIAREMWRVVRPGGLILSYDMRPAPEPVRLLRRATARRRKKAGIASGTPTAPVTIPELHALWPAAEVRTRSITVAADLDPLVDDAPSAARTLQRLPMLRTHLMAVITKGDHADDPTSLR
jgi:hypothetical protein